MIIYACYQTNSTHNFTCSDSKILIIDDDKTFTKRLSYSLTCYRKGIEVITALSGKIGLNYIKENGFRLILLDLKMKGMNGLEVLKKIRRMRKKYIVIILTAFAEDELIQQVIEEKPEEIFDKACFKIEYLDPYLCL